MLWEPPVTMEKARRGDSRAGEGLTRRSAEDAGPDDAPWDVVTGTEVIRHLSQVTERSAPRANRRRTGIRGRCCTGEGPS